MYIYSMDTNLLRGSLETIIVHLLSQQEEMYGYEITKMVKELSQGHIKLTEGALYPKLHKLEADGILEVETKSIGNRYRKYYKLTDKGQKEKTNLLAEMNEYINTMALILNLKPI